MYCTGFADEASASLDGQIKATKELDWEYIESRGIDGTNIHDLDDADFDKVCEMLDQSGVKVNCFGSAIANWGKQITDPFELTIEAIERTIPRMHRLDSKLIRIMSYAVLKDRPAEDQMEEERFRRLREIVKRFQDAGIQPVHENCMNYGGMGWPFTLKMVENVPGLKLVYDTGNPIFSDDRSKPQPHPKQSSWEFYSHVKDHIAYVHIKDGVFEGEKTNYTFPGEGDGDVQRIVKDLLDNGYDGGFSMEPHMAVVHHEEDSKSDDQIRFDNYVEYGRRFEQLIRDVGHGEKLTG